MEEKKSIYEETGMSREDAYKVVQSNSMQVWEDVQQARPGKTLRERLSDDPACVLTEEQLDQIFDPWSFLTRSGIMFDRLEQLSFE